MKTTLMFLLGGIVGYTVGYTIAKQKWNEIAEEEIASIKEHYTVPKGVRASDASSHAATANNNSTVKRAVAPKTPCADDRIAYNKIASSYAADEAKTGGDDVTADTKDMPCVIPPDEFGANSEYSIYYYIWYNGDSTLVDEDTMRCVPGENIDMLIGVDTLDRFGEFESGYVYAENPELKMYFRIEYSDRSFYGDD